MDSSQPKRSSTAEENVITGNSEHSFNESKHTRNGNMLNGHSIQTLKSQVPHNAPNISKVCDTPKYIKSDIEHKIKADTISNVLSFTIYHSVNTVEQNSEYTQSFNRTDYYIKDYMDNRHIQTIATPIEKKYLISMTQPTFSEIIYDDKGTKRVGNSLIKNCCNVF